MAKLLCITDTHGNLGFSCEYLNTLQKAVNNVDAVFCMGDIYKNELTSIVEIVKEKDIPIYGIPGNHEPAIYIKETGIMNIHGDVCRVKGLAIAGIGGCIRYKNSPELCMMTDKESTKLAKTIPKADILITHSSYKRKTNNVVHSGLKGISWYIKKNNPKYHLYGHLHKNEQKELKNGTISVCIYQAAIFNSDTGVIKHLF